MAITTASGSMRLFTQFTVKKANTGLNDSKNSQSYSTTASFASVGVGPNQFDELYAAVLTIAAGGSTTLDLVGALANFFGETINAVRVKGMAFELLNDTAAVSVTVGNGTNPWKMFLGGGSQSFDVRNGGFVAAACDDAVGYAGFTAGTADSVKITNNDGSLSAVVRVTFFIGKS